MFVIEPDQQNPSAAAAASDLDRHAAAILRHIDVSCGSTPLLGPLNGRLNILAMRAHVASGAVHNDFWGIGAVSETPSIPVLPLRRRFQRKRVLPAQSVPVGDMERQR